VVNPAPRLFLPFMADGEGPFEWMQRRAKSSGDPIAGQPGGADVVAMRGGDYFVVPPLPFFARLSGPAQPRSLRAAASSATVQRSSRSTPAAIVHDWTIFTEPPCTKNVSPLKAHSALAR
jgi:hypothetical protein